MHNIFFFLYYTIYRLLVFVVILALSNLGTSFASAILAKDTTTNSSSGSPELVDKKTGETIATDQAIERFTSEVVTEDDLFNRGLATFAYGSTSSRMLQSSARDMLRKCKQGNKIVKLTALWGGSEPAERTVCHHSWSCVPRFDDNDSLQWGILCLQGTNPLEHVYVNRDESDTDYYIISSTDPDATTATTTTTTTTTQWQLHS